MNNLGNVNLNKGIAFFSTIKPAKIKNCKSGFPWGCSG